MWNRILFCLALTPLFLGGCGNESGLEQIIISIKGEKFSVELARTREEQQTGLMFRKSMDARKGMLFVYDHYVKGAFWMKNTYIPLSIAFIADDGKIVDIKDMQPLSQKSVPSRFSYMYALEVNQGVLGELGISVGDLVEFPDGFR